MIGLSGLAVRRVRFTSELSPHPEQHESRRWLDLLMGSEDRQAGLTHGRQLIRRKTV